MKIITTLILILLFGFTAQVTNPLPGSSWRLYSISDTKKGQTDNFYELNSTLSFSDTTLHITACNAIKGIYKFHVGNKITMHSISATEMYCPTHAKMEDYISASFFDMRFTVHHDTLELYGVNGLNFKYLRE